MSDRTLDRQVAERLFDRHLVGNTSACMCRKEHIIEARQYSTDLSAMMQVIERMQRLGWEVSLWDRAIGGWYAKMYKGGDEYKRTGKTMPQAVCLAALAACSHYHESTLQEAAR